MLRAKEPVSINGLEFDALIDNNESYSATVPEYAVEEGYTVSDAILLGAETVSMTLYVTNTPITWYEKHGGDTSRVESVCQQLKEIFFEKKPVTIRTSDATSENMAIESLSIGKSKDVGYAREIPISFRKIRTVKAKTTTIPDSYGKSGKTAENAGTASTSTSSKGSSSSSSSKSSSSSSGSSGKSESKGSILYNAASSFGLM